MCDADGDDDADGGGGDGIKAVVGVHLFVCVGVHNFVLVSKNMVKGHQIDTNHNFARKRIHFFSMSHHMHRRNSSWMRPSHEFLI